jgi:hypothetical protein
MHLYHSAYICRDGTVNQSAERRPIGINANSGSLTIGSTWLRELSP